MTKEDWRQIAATLPPGVDPRKLKAALAAIRSRGKIEAAANSYRLDSLKRRALLDALDDLPDLQISNREQLVQQLVGRLEENNRRARALERAIPKTPRLSYQEQKDAILNAWQSAGGDLHVSTPARGDPRGDAIPFLIIAVEIITGKTIGPRQAKREITECYRPCHFYCSGAAFIGKGDIK
jgi:hypothetical protein